MPEQVSCPAALGYTPASGSITYCDAGTNRCVHFIECYIFCGLDHSANRVLRSPQDSKHKFLKQGRTVHSFRLFDAVAYEHRSRYKKQAISGCPKLRQDVSEFHPPHGRKPHASNFESVEDFIRNFTGLFIIVPLCSCVDHPPSVRG